MEKRRVRRDKMVLEVKKNGPKESSFLSGISCFFFCFFVSTFKL